LTVIVAVFNGKTTLQQCVNSVVQQTYPNKELIIIDGGSSDGTVDLIRANRTNIAYWISEPDRGIYNAWNKGLEQARGDWICFLGADDYLWDATVLERAATRLALLPPEIRVAYGQIMLVGAGDEPLRVRGEPWPQVKELFKRYMCIPHVATMHRQSLFKQRGNFDESFRIAGDYELLLRELKVADAEFFPAITMAGHRLGGISTDPKNYLPTLWETWRAQRMHVRILPSKYVLREMAKECLRLLLWKILGESLARKLLDFRRNLKGLPPHWTKI
jgi:glycosyltransferase involved in cell wall biosynthesis